MLNEAIKKIEDEMKKEEKNEYVQYIGKYLIDHIHEYQDHAQNILTEGKTVLGSLKHMQGVAMKKKSGNVAVLTPEQGFKAVLEYYEINDNVPVVIAGASEAKPKKKLNIDLEDLF